MAIPDVAIVVAQKVPNNFVKGRFSAKKKILEILKLPRIAPCAPVSLLAVLAAAERFKITKKRYVIERISNLLGVQVERLNSGHNSSKDLKVWQKNNFLQGRTPDKGVG